MVPVILLAAVRLLVEATPLLALVASALAAILIPIAVPLASLLPAIIDPAQPLPLQAMAPFPLTPVSILVPVALPFPTA